MPLDFLRIEDLTRRDIWINRINPIAKLIITIAYIVLTVSVNKNNLSGLLMMLPYLLVGFIIYEISFTEAIKRLRYVIPFLVLIGITSGLYSFISLFLKGCFTVFATYIFVSTTAIDDFCFSLRKMHVPAIIVTEILLIYRYIGMLVNEVERMTVAYKMRAPGQKGINIKAWGPFIGNFLLRTMDRAELVYESMQLRGYNDSQGVVSQKDLSIKLHDICYVLAAGCFIYLCYKGFYLW